MDEIEVATWAVVANISAHAGFVAPLCGQSARELEEDHCQVIYMGREEDASAFLKRWLDCPAAREDRYCYSHNPTPRAGDDDPIRRPRACRRRD